MKNQYITASATAAKCFFWIGGHKNSARNTDVSHKLKASSVVCIPMVIHTVEPYADPSQRKGRAWSSYARIRTMTASTTAPTIDHRITAPRSGLLAAAPSSQAGMRLSSMAPMNPVPAAMLGSGVPDGGHDGLRRLK